MSQYDILIAHYGHPLLPGAKHWAIIVLTNKKERKGIAYQVEGSTKTYKVKQPKEVDVMASVTYMGSVEVGHVRQDTAFGSEPGSLHTILMETPVVHRDRGWNCQNWVISGLERLRKAGHGIYEVTLQGLQYQLAQVDKKNQ